MGELCMYIDSWHACGAHGTTMITCNCAKDFSFECYVLMKIWICISLHSRNGDAQVFLGVFAVLGSRLVSIVMGPCRSCWQSVNTLTGGLSTVQPLVLFFFK